MAITQLNPYLNFNGTAATAIALYERALGAKSEHVMRFGDTPGSAPEHKDRIMHAMLRVGGGVIMISDTMPSEPATSGTNQYVCLNFDQPDDLIEKFNALSDGAKITMPVQDTFWGAKFGTLTDAHGIHWMFNCTLEPKQ